VFEMAKTTPPNSNLEPMAALFHVGSNRTMPAPPPGLGADGIDFVNACLRHTPSERPTCAALLEHPFVARFKDKVAPGTPSPGTPVMALSRKGSKSAMP
jgi:serine/threonine protein kinase